MRTEHIFVILSCIRIKAEFSTNKTGFSSYPPHPPPPTPQSPPVHTSTPAPVVLTVPMRGSFVANLLCLCDCGYICGVYVLNYFESLLLWVPRKGCPSWLWHILVSSIKFYVLRAVIENEVRQYCKADNDIQKQFVDLPTVPWKVRIKVNSK